MELIGIIYMKVKGLSLQKLTPLFFQQVRRQMRREGVYVVGT
jgi:hypothetical protein